MREGAGVAGSHDQYRFATPGRDSPDAGSFDSVQDRVVRIPRDALRIGTDGRHLNRRATCDRHLLDLLIAGPIEREPLAIRRKTGENASDSSSHASPISRSRFRGSFARHFASRRRTREGAGLRSGSPFTTDASVSARSSPWKNRLAVTIS